MGNLVVKHNCPFFAVKRGNSSFSSWSNSSFSSCLLVYLLLLSPHSLLAGETFLDGSCWISSKNLCFSALTANILTKLKFRTGFPLVGWICWVFSCWRSKNLLDCVTQLQSSENTVFCPFSMIILFWFCIDDF